MFQKKGNVHIPKHKYTKATTLAIKQKKLLISSLLYHNHIASPHIKKANKAQSRIQHIYARQMLYHMIQQITFYPSNFLFFTFSQNTLKVSYHSR